MRLVPKIKSENASSSKWNSNDLLVFTLSRLNIQNRVYIFAAKKGETDGNNLFASGYISFSNEGKHSGNTYPENFLIYLLTQNFSIFDVIDKNAIVQLQSQV